MADGKAKKAIVSMYEGFFKPFLMFNSLTHKEIRPSRDRTDVGMSLNFKHPCISLCLSERVVVKHFFV